MSKKDYRTLQSYSDYVNLYEELINGLLDQGPLAGTIDSKKAQAIGLLSGYAGTALKNAHGGKTQLTVFLKDMHRVNVSSMSNEQMLEFLQGDETTQIEILQQIKDIDGLNTIEAQVLPKKIPEPKLDKEVVASMSGIAPKDIEDVLKGKAPDTVERKAKRKHDWQRTIGKSNRYCHSCGLEKEELTAEDMGDMACSDIWGLY